MSWLSPIDIGLQTGLVQAWAVLGFAIAFRLLSFPDLTIEGSLPLGAAVFALLVREGQPLFVATVAAIVAGALLGALTAVLHVRFQINKLLAGIIVVSIAYSLSLRTMGGPNVGLLLSPSLFDVARRLDEWGFARLHLGTVLVLGIALGALAIIAAWSFRTRSGLRLIAAGSNPDHARALGIPAGSCLILGLALTNGLAALGGALMSSRQGFADVGLGQGTLILALASLLLGERLTPKKRFRLSSYVLASAISGSVVYATVISLAIRAGVAATDLRLATAALVLVVVARNVSREREAFQDAVG